MIARGVAKLSSKSKSKSVFVCQSCGAQRARWEGKCSDCGAWNSLVEERIAPEAPARGLSSRASSAGQERGWQTGGGAGRVTRLSESRSLADGRRQDVDRKSTGFHELDRVLGGGLVKGSFILVGGDPGIGKSTLLLQMAGGLAERGSKVLYVSGEESVDQTSLRAERLGLTNSLDSILVASESQLETIRDITANEMSLAFAGIWLFSVIDRSRRAALDRQGFDAQYVRCQTGIGAASATTH